MNVKINVENAVMIAGDYSYARSDFETYRNRKYPGWGGPSKGQDRDLDNKYDHQARKDEALWAVSAVTGIDCKVLLDLNRISDKLIEKTGGMKCLYRSDYERLIEIMTAKTPEDLAGVYRNEYFERAWAKIEAIRYETGYYKTGYDECFM